MMGEVNPVEFMDGSAAGVQKVKDDTRNLLQNVMPVLKENGFQSKYILSTGCEIPPGGPLSTVQAMVNTVKELGPDLQKNIMG